MALHSPLGKLPPGLTRRALAPSGLIPLAAAPWRVSRVAGGRSNGVRRLYEDVRGGSPRLLPCRASAPHHHHAYDADEENHQSSQVALLALVPIGLMGLKWAISTGPLSLAVPAVLLAFPVVGSGLRQLLAEGLSMAIRCSAWVQLHQPPKTTSSSGRTTETHQGAYHHPHQHHAHASSSSSDHSHGGARRSPGVSTAVMPGSSWAAQAVSTHNHSHPQAQQGAMYPHHNAAHNSMPPGAYAGPQSAAAGSPARSMPPAMLQRQPVGAWGDATVPLPASRHATTQPHPGAWSPRQQQQHPAGAASLAMAHGPARGASPRPVASNSAHAPPTSRPTTMAPPTQLQQLADVQQCEDLDWEVDAQRHQENCGGTAPNSYQQQQHVAAPLAATATSDGQALQHHRHHHQHHGPQHLHRQPQGPAPSQRNPYPPRIAP